MSESDAISGVVNSLKTVRDQYQEQLQNVPQYATFLRVQQLTEISSAALGIPAGTEGFSSAHDVVAALSFARDKFKEHLANVPEYRALLSINELITKLEVAEQPPIPEPVEETPTAEAEPATEVAAAPAAEPVQETAQLTGVLGHHDSYDSAVDEALAEVPSLSGLPAAAEPIAAAEAAAVAAEAPTVETTVGEVAYAPQPENAAVAEPAPAFEAPTEATGAERAA
ncbi:MAG: hypothetical protein K2X60_01265 [Xanthobacteraceae bacterium]|nr:hypothetical protein [Xanthobacteraceae bacterium]